MAENTNVKTPESEKEDEIITLLEKCQMKETLHEAFENLDKLAEKSFDSFVRALVDVLTLVNGSVNDKVRAAKEMHRQMNSPSERFAKIQMQKWKDLDKTTKTHVEVSLLDVLRAIGSTEIIGPIVDIFSVMADTWSNCCTNIVKISLNTDSSMHTLIACFEILGRIPSRLVKLDDCALMFSNGLSLPGPIYCQDTFQLKQCAILKFSLVYLDKFLLHTTGDPLNEKMKFLEKLCETIMDKEVLKLANEIGCDTAIKLMIKVLTIQQRLLNRNLALKPKSIEKWDKLLLDGLRTQLYAVCSDAMEMKLASKSAANFFLKFDQFVK